jgi:hypothetical protein
MAIRVKRNVGKIVNQTVAIPSTKHFHVVMSRRMRDVVINPAESSAIKDAKNISNVATNARQDVVNLVPQPVRSL